VTFERSGFGASAPSALSWVRFQIKPDPAAGCRQQYCWPDGLTSEARPDGWIGFLLGGSTAVYVARDYMELRPLRAQLAVPAAGSRPTSGSIRAVAARRQSGHCAAARVERWPRRLDTGSTMRGAAIVPANRPMTSRSTPAHIAASTCRA
jgi:hypothetical protein